VQLFKNIFFLIILCILPGLLISQTRPYYFKNYQVSQGLSSNIITAITQDRKGFMWFGSRNGLNRFDGSTFKVFRNKPNDALSLGSNSIFSLFEDKHEELWVGTYKGIYIYNPQSETFRLFSRIPAGEVRYIRGDGQQHIWIISDLQLYCYNERTTQLTVFPLDHAKLITLSVGRDGTVWTATNNGMVCRLTPGSRHFTTFDIAAANSGRRFSVIQEVYPVGDTAVLIGTMNQAVLYNFRKNRLDQVLAGRRALNDVHVHTIFHQTDDEYWMGTEAGLYTFKIGGRQIIRIEKQYSNPYAITDNIISAIYRDREGGTWLGTYFGGINYYSAQYNNFRKYFPEPGQNSLSGNIVHEICKDNEGNLWVGTEDAGLNEINARTGHITHFLPNGPGSIAYHNIHGLLADGNKLWVGTYEHGLDVMDLKTKKVTRHYAANMGRNPFTSNFIVALFRTSSGDVLVGTWTGLFRYNPTTDDFTLLPFFNAPIQSIQEDEAGTLWVSSYGGGVYYSNTRTGRQGHLHYQAGQPNTLINNYVNHLFEDRSHHWWFCTESGLSGYDPATGKFANFTVENGLPDNQVFRVLEDSSGHLWISTAKGLARFDPHSRSFEAFHAPNGLPTEQFNYNSAFQDTDGTMYFGTEKGMVSFQPARFYKNRFVPPVYLTGIQFNNKDVDIHRKEGLLRQSITYARTLTLPYDSANISLDAAALSYIVPEMNRYQYQLEGIDRNWIHLKNNRKIYYTNLPPGNYTFRIRGSTSEGIWNPKAAVLHIHILPPYWATWWAYILYALIAVAIALIIARYYHLAIFEKNKRQIESIEMKTEREIYNAKIEFFTNVAHEIRTPLTLIKMPLDKLLGQPVHSPEVNDSLNMIKKNTNRLIDLTNQLLDFRKAEANKFSLNFSKTDINELLNDLYSVFKPTAEIKGLAFRLELPRITLFAFVDPEALKKILSNLFNNAIKYAKRNVTIKLMPFSSEDLLFSVEVRNDGFQIPEAYSEKIFEPFYRIKETEKEAGTGIGLPLSRSLAVLHKGGLELKNNNGQENIFLLSLPIHQEIEIDFARHETGSLEEENEESESADALNPDAPRILLVEDNKDILNYIQHELSSRYRVLKAHHGAEALKILESEHVQLVISDIMMPVMDGISLCRKMKTGLAYSHIPIILLTAKNSLHSKIEGLEVGADAYIEKPFAFEYLLAQIVSLLTNRNIVKEYFARSPLTHIKGIGVSKTDKDFLEHLNQLIYDNITNLNLDVDQLSSMMNMSRPTLYRKIKGLSDMTPNELINLSRLKKAAELLAEGNYKINEVANMVGYTLPSNFSRDFQRQFSVSPSQYLHNLKEQPKTE
jgi:ligand-binding sensor domain-containing protein/signal transduction histidine kinase/DNA-binding response OmpR family regulator